MTDNRRPAQGSAYLGGFTLVTIWLCVGVSVLSLLSALLKNDDDIAGPLFWGTTLGAFALWVTTCRVRWKVADGILELRQMCFRFRVPVEDIAVFATESGMAWKQGVGLRWLGGKDWAMVCGTDELIAVEYGERKLIFSVSDAAAVIQAVGPQEVREGVL